MLTYQDIQNEVARRATKDQSGGQFTVAIQVAINASLFRLAREFPWRVLRRTSTFMTVTSYSSYNFTVNRVIVSPSAGDQYQINNSVYIIKYVSIVAGSGTISCTTNASMQLLSTGTSGVLTRIAGSGDLTINVTNTTGPAITTRNSTNVTITNGSLITDGIQVGRKIKFASDGRYYYITQITSESTLVLDWPIQTGGSLTDSYEILPVQGYNLPPQCSHRMFMWHEAYGYPFKMTFITDQDFYRTGMYLTIKYIPTHYMMWGEDWVLNQPLQPGIMSVSSSSSTDANIGITIFGTVAGYPDSENITVNGITPVNGLKQFSVVERVAKASPSIGRITVTSDSGKNMVSVIPTGDVTNGILYSKVQLYPLPNMAFPMHIWYYKDPYALVNPGDIHEMGQEFDEAIILLATSKIKAESNLTEGATFYELYKDELKSLKKHNTDKMDFFSILRRPFGQGGSDAFFFGNVKYSQLGGFYGPSSRS